MSPNTDYAAKVSKQPEWNSDLSMRAAFAYRLKDKCHLACCRCNVKKKIDKSATGLTQIAKLKGHSVFLQNGYW
jgi:uncharacterized Fe-S radical SAM superfamily protein PflX